MKRRLLALILILFLPAIFSINSFAYDKELKGLSDTLAGKIAKTSKKSVAVVDFTDLQGNVTEFGRFIAEEISVNLTMAEKGFEVIDRNHLKSLLTEHKLSVSGLVDPDTIKKIGQISGVNSLVTGSVTPFGDNIRVTCKVIATDTAKIITADKTELAKTKAIDELLSRGIQSNNVIAKNNKFQLPSPTLSSDNNTELPRPIEIDDFVFELKGATLSGNEVTINLEATNKSKRRSLNFDYGIGNNSIKDNHGNKYGGVMSTPVSASCEGDNGSRKTKKKKISKKRSGVNCSTYLGTLESFKKTVTFGDVSPHITILKNFSTAVKIDNQNYHNLDFYNVPLRREE